MADIDHYSAYLKAQAIGEYLVMAHALSGRGGNVLFYEENAERKFHQLAADLGFKVEKLPTVNAETATREAA